VVDPDLELRGRGGGRGWAPPPDPPLHMPVNSFSYPVHTNKINERFVHRD